MKIGILTFHAPCNFGANLQAYSSSNYFSNLGHDVRVINYLRKADNEDYRDKVGIVQFSAHREFITTKLRTTEPVISKNELILLVKKCKFDLIIVGADAVWRAPNDGRIYFLDWLFSDPELKDISVASMSVAHMGDGFQTMDLKSRAVIRESLNRFCYLSVRDSWTKKVLERDIFNERRDDININPDPVFLLDQFIGDEWYNVSENIKTKKYFLMTLPRGWIMSPKHYEHRLCWFQNFKKIVNNAGYHLVELPLPEGVSGIQFDYTVPYPIDPIQWYLWIKNAKAFCGLRFHAIVSSIAGGTPFYSIDSYGSSALPVLIMSRLGLYRLARLFDFKSKIRNLLKNTPFEFCRISRNIESISPKCLFSILKRIDTHEILKFRDKNISIFKRNMQILLEKASSK